MAKRNIISHLRRNIPPVKMWPLQGLPPLTVLRLLLTPSGRRFLFICVRYNLFDRDFYVEQHRDELGARINPLGHYLRNGTRAGYDPNPFFDNGWYAENNDLNSRSALQHFVCVGESAGASPHPLWDEARYLDLNRDVQLWTQLRSTRTGYRHFIRQGAHELESGAFRTFNFTWGDHDLGYDPIAYKADNPDVVRAIEQKRYRSGIEHFFHAGFQEARKGSRTIYGPHHAVRLMQDLPGEAPAGGKHLCLFAHYDSDGLIDPYIVTYLKSLRKVGVDIVFVTATQTQSELKKILPLVRRILVKNDTARDFGSWWLALKTLGLDCGADYKRVIFANDSIYFPVRPIEPLFADMDVRAYNMYGLSDSRQMAYHLQSFFLAFDRAAQKAVFQKFCEKFEHNYILTKWGQVMQYEIGLTQIAQDSFLSIGAYFSIDDARELIMSDPGLAKWTGLVRFGVNDVNPTHHLWDFMIGVCGWPGLKLELLRDNPTGRDGLEQLPRLIADGDVPYSEITRHVIRSKKNISIPISFPKAAEHEPSQIVLRNRISGSGPRVAQRLVLFAHYDPDYMIDDHIVFQIAALSRAGCAVAFITSTDDTGELSKILPYVSDVLIKNDTGRDFGSWALAIRTLKEELRNYDWVIWMNDSTYFPLFDLTQMFERMENQKLDFWGIVDSYSVKWHIMSWFWAFGRKAVDAGWFDWYLKEYNASYTKWGQIHNYEIRIPEAIKASGLNTGVYIAADDVGSFILSEHSHHPRLNSAKRGDFNMAHDFWKEIIVNYRSPALKVELCRDNPLGIDLSEVLQIVRDHTNYDPELIRRHLLRLKKDSSLPPTSHKQT